MAIKYGSTNITIVKHGTASISTVYHGGTKVFPDATYQELEISLSADTQEYDFRVYFDNPNNFSVTITGDGYWENSTGDGSESFSLTVGPNDYDGISFGSYDSTNIYYVSVDLQISGGGYSWTQFHDEDYR